MGTLGTIRRTKRLAHVRVVDRTEVGARRDELYVEVRVVVLLELDHAQPVAAMRCDAMRPGILMTDLQYR